MSDIIPQDLVQFVEANRPEVLPGQLLYCYDKER